jgi:hypothetical protein
MKDLNIILNDYPNLKTVIDRDKPKIYNSSTNTKYVYDNKLSPNLGLIYDFGGTDGPVEGENVTIIDYDPNKDISQLEDTKTYDKDFTIYKYNSKDKSLTLPDSLEVNGKISILYANILKFPKQLKSKELSLSFCKMEDYLFNSKLFIEGDLTIIKVSYNGTDLIKNLITPEMGDVSKYTKYPNGESGYPQPVVDKVRNLIEQNGGYVKGEIILQ